MKRSALLLLFCCALGAVAAEKFENVTAAMKLEGIGGMEAASWGDYDNDGFTDLFVLGIYHNEGGESFEKVSPGQHHMSVADYNRDGFLDVAGLGEAAPEMLLLSYNGKTGKWDDHSAKFQDKVPTYRPFSSFWADFNGDGFLDYYVAGMTNSSAWPDGGTHDYIYFANKTDSFKLGWTSPGVANSRGATPCDFDRDGDIDVYTSDYWMTPDYLWRNDGTGKFDDAGAALGIPQRNGHGVGSCWGDFDNDGWIDLYVSNFSHPGNPPPAFARSVAGKRFEDRGTGGIGWVESQGCAAAGDYDNDGDLDLFITALYTPRCRLLRNNGKFQFTDVTAEFGLAGIGPTSQDAWADYDNDGYLDLCTGGALYRNPGGANHWLKVKLTSVDPKVKVNASAVGAQVRIKVPWLGTLTRQVETATGVGNQNDLTMHFGLGTHTGPLTLEIFWPDTAIQKVEIRKVDQLVEVRRDPQAVPLVREPDAGNGDAAAVDAEPSTQAAMRLTVAVRLKDLDDRVGFIFDAEAPESPRQLNLSSKETVTFPVFDEFFAVNFLHEGKNVNVQCQASAEYGIRFDKWVDGGDVMEVVIDTDANPPTLTIQKLQGKHVSVRLVGLGDYVAHIFDAKNPEEKVNSLKLHGEMIAPTLIFDKVFGLNFIYQGKNIYAQFVIDAAGGIRFDKWVDGGEGLVSSVDNEGELPLVTVKSKP